jgi:hypothetical protein
MARGPCTFTKADVIRALKAAQKAGLTVHKFEIDRSGKIVIVTDQSDYPTSDVSRNEWDVPSAGETQQ